MEAFFQKYGWAINFAVIGAATLLAALLVNGFVAAQLSQYTVPNMPSFADVERQAPQVPADDGDRDQWVDALADRCLFGCPEEVDPDACPEGCPEGKICEAGECVAEEPEEEEYFDADIPRQTELDLKLRGVLAAQNPRWSIAMIIDESDNETHVAGVGDIVPGDDPVEVLEIRRDRVFIDNDGQLEFIRIEGSPDADPVAQRREEASSPRQDPAERRQRQVAERRERAQRARTDSEDDEDADIVQEGENQYAVNRQRVEAALEEPESLASEARIMPNYRDGEPNGLRLVGVSSNSLYSDLGIRSGDVIHSVNGTPINSQQDAMKMLESMGNEDQVVIEVERRGQRQKMEYNIR